MKGEKLRRSRGDGSIYRRKDGLWVARYEAAGKRKYLYGKTRKIVADKLREKLASGEANLNPQGDTLRVGEYLDRWLPTVKDTVKERTWRRHEEVVRLHLKPAIGKIKIRDLNPLDVQELYRMKLNLGFSPRTVQIVHTTLYKALKQAVRWSLISRNVTEAVMPPKSQKKDVRTLSSKEVRRLFEAVKGQKFEALYVLAVTTGMRQGELLGLKWDDVDLAKGVLQVKRTIWAGQATPPKSAKGNRSVTLTRMAKEALKKHKERNGSAEWVFATRAGTPVSCHNLINRSWWPLLKDAGLPRIPFHNLRHTCATLLLVEGLHPKLVQELLGHADITTTLNTYSHVLPSLQEKTASAMEDIMDDALH